MFDLSEGCVLYDPLAVAVAADPTLMGTATYTDMALAVETQGVHTRGATVPIDGPANVRVLTDCDGETSVSSMLAGMLAAGTSLKN